MEKIFKAKRLDNGEWRVFSISDVLSMGFSGFLIDTQTICQYTGINDSKGQRIYEGDELTDCNRVKFHVRWHSYKAGFVGDDDPCMFYVYTLTGHNIYDKVKK